MRIAGAAVTVVVLAGAWSAGWFYAAHRAGKEIDAWLATEAQLGRHWTCPARTISGFPIAASVSCANPTFTGRGLGQSVEGSVAGMVGEVSILHPATVNLRLAPPLTYRTADGDAELTATWKRFEITVDGPLDVRNVALRAHDIEVEGVFAGVGKQRGTAGDLTADFTPSKRPSDPTIAYTIGLKTAEIPVLDALVGGRDAVDGKIEGRIDHTDIGAARTPEEAAEKWRRAGGSIDLAQSTVKRGETSVRAHGNLRLDEAHRVAGKLEATFVGLGPVLKRYGINGNLVAIGSLLSTMFGGKPSREPVEPGAVTLPIRFEQGRLAVGPIVTQVQLSPVY